MYHEYYILFHFLFKRKILKICHFSSSKNFRSTFENQFIFEQKCILAEGFYLVYEAVLKLLRRNEKSQLGNEKHINS
jgi:hypothetical protein